MYNEYAVYKVRADKSTGWIDHQYIYIRTHPPFRRPIHSGHIVHYRTTIALFNKTLAPYKGIVSAHHL